MLTLHRNSSVMGIMLLSTILLSYTLKCTKNKHEDIQSVPCTTNCSFKNGEVKTGPSTVCIHVITVMGKVNLWRSLILRKSLEKHKNWIKTKVVLCMISIWTCSILWIQITVCVHVFVNQAKHKVNPLTRCFWKCIMVCGMHIWLFRTVLAITLEMKSRADLLDI